MTRCAELRLFAMSFNFAYESDHLPRHALVKHKDNRSAKGVFLSAARAWSPRRGCGDGILYPNLLWFSEILHAAGLAKTSSGQRREFPSPESCYVWGRLFRCKGVDASASTPSQVCNVKQNPTHFPHQSTRCCQDKLRQEKFTRVFISTSCQ
jgi:hypothetical protein